MSIGNGLRYDQFFVGLNPSFEVKNITKQDAKKQTELALFLVWCSIVDTFIGNFQNPLYYYDQLRQLYVSWFHAEKFSRSISMFAIFGEFDL